MRARIRRRKDLTPEKQAKLDAASLCGTHARILRTGCAVLLASISVDPDEYALIGSLLRQAARMEQEAEESRDSVWARAAKKAKAA